jgi:hypothetical protein
MQDDVGAKSDFLSALAIFNQETRATWLAMIELHNTKSERHLFRYNEGKIQSLPSTLMLSS